MAQMNSNKTGMLLPEVIDLILSFVSPRTLYTCLYINRAWNTVAYPRFFAWAKLYLEWGAEGGCRFQALLASKTAQAALERNFGVATDLVLMSHSQFLILKDMTTIVNLTSFRYGLSVEHSTDQSVWVLKTLEKNKRLCSVSFGSNPFRHRWNHHNPLDNTLATEKEVEGPQHHGDSIQGFVTTLQSLQYLTRLDFFGVIDIAGLKVLLDAVPTLESLKTLNVEVDQDTSLENVTTTAVLVPSRVLQIETLSVLISSHIGIDSSNHFRLLVFPLLCNHEYPKLKCLGVSSLTVQDVAGLETLLLSSRCPAIENLTFFGILDEIECTILAQSCPNLTSIDARRSSEWDLSDFVPGIIRDPTNLCVRLQELVLSLTWHGETSKMLQKLFCSLPNLRKFKMENPDDKYAAGLFGHDDDEPVSMSEEEPTTTLYSDPLEDRWILEHKEEGDLVRKTMISQVYAQLVGYDLREWIENPGALSQISRNVGRFVGEDLPDK
ncbi:hypothetical protein BG004_001279 [Podila humilis]|nr:hypothetical protein BG004_001279 [Podila humilis]